MGKPWAGALAYRVQLAPERDIKLDIAGTYPEEEYLLNISKETTAIELARIHEVSEDTQREFGLNLNGGISNAVELCVGMFKLPSPDELLKQFRLDMGA
jgi:hypothetical protein